MAKGPAASQHYLECDNCEENPAKFICKTCAGNLCKPCKDKHKNKKINRNHEILSLNSNTEDMLDLFLCPKHVKKRLECYCTPCSEPVCTDCIIQFHNGHSVESLSKVHRKITDYSKQKREQIEDFLLPSHTQLLAKEEEKRSALKKKADEIQEKIDAHTQSMVEIVKNIGQQTVVDLRKAERKGLQEMNKFEKSLEAKVSKLQLMSKQLSANLEAKPQPSIFKSIEHEDLKSLQALPHSAEYTLTDFQPYDMDIENMFGKSPVLDITRSKKMNVSKDRKALDCKNKKEDSDWIPLEFDEKNEKSKDWEPINYNEKKGQFKQCTPQNYDNKEEKPRDWKPINYSEQKGQLKPCKLPNYVNKGEESRDWEQINYSEKKGQLKQCTPKNYDKKGEKPRDWKPINYSEQKGQLKPCKLPNYVNKGEEARDWEQINYNEKKGQLKQCTPKNYDSKGEKPKDWKPINYSEQMGQLKPCKLPNYVNKGEESRDWEQINYNEKMGQLKQCTPPNYDSKEGESKDRKPLNYSEKKGQLKQCTPPNYDNKGGESTTCEPLYFYEKKEDLRSSNVCSAS